MKFIRVLLLAMLCVLAMPTFAQLTIGTVDPGPYTPGTTIAATFSIDPSSCINQNNVFSLRLSDAAGNFSNNPATIIGTYDGFYGTFVNGVIPANTPLGNGYKVRIESSSPVLITAESNAFEIVSGNVVLSRLISSRSLCGNQDAFGFSVGQTGANASIDLVNQSTTGGFVTTTVTNEANGATTVINFTTPQQNFEPELTHYTLFVKNEMPNGTVATKAYFIINNRANTSFTTSGSAYVCLPGGALQYFIDVTSPNGIQNNFPGNTYKINWGDDSENTYTFCALKSGVVEHNYLKSSCGEEYRVGNTVIYNAFGINVQVVSPFCGNVGTGVSTTAKVVDITQNKFNAPSQACTNTLVSFTNISILGDDPENTGPSCKPDNARFNWYIDGILQEANQPRSFIFTHRFTQNGTFTVRLESTGTTGCRTIPYNQQICIQDAPIPQFSFAENTICGPTTVKPSNTSVVDENCQPGKTYQWNVTPAVNFANGTDATSAEPEFIFNPGTYQVTLAVTTNSCGTITSAPQTIVVNSAPSAILSPDQGLCNLGTYDFNNTTSGPTKTILEGTAADLANTYTWTVTSTGTYNFVDGTGPNSKYPKIQFNDYAEYTITVVHQNNCGTATDSQKIWFTAAPVVNAGSDQTICFNENAVTLNGSVTGSTLSQAWFGGEGIFIPSRNDLNATYQPSATEKANGMVTLTLRATTNLPSPCNDIPDDIIIHIKPQLTVNSASTASICTGQSVNYSPTSATVGSTFTWTASGSANAGGFSASGSGTILDVLTNSDPTANATVTYIITPTGNGCTGIPFTFTVTITPKPVLTAIATNTTICSTQSTGITLLANLANTQYIYTSTATNGITGNTNNNNPSLINSINDILINNSTTVGRVDYTITPISANGCEGTPVVVSINVTPQTSLAVAGPDEEICNTNSYTFKAIEPVVGTGLWTQITTFANVTFTNADKFNGSANGLVPGNTYTFRWTVTGSNGCNETFDEVSITINPTSFGGTTTGSTNVCAGTNSGQITLNGNIGNVVRWESSTDGGLTYPNIFNNTTNTLSYANVAVSTYYRAVVQSGVCAPAFSTPAIITVNPVTTTANAGQDQNLCNATSTVLAANQPSANETGLWTVIPANPSITFADATQYNTTVNGLVGGQTYTFRYTITGLAPCPPSSDDVVVNNLSALLNNNITSPSTTFCTGQTITLTGSTPTGGNGNYTYIWESSIDGNAPWTAVAGQTGKDLNVVVNGTQSYRRIVNSGPCSSTSNAITVIALPPIANNTISSDPAPICENTAPGQLVGSQPTGGDGTNYNYTWEQSTDEITWQQIAGATAQNYQPGNLPQTTSYRRIVSTTTCSGLQNNISNVFKITVNPNAKAEFLPGNTLGCVPFNLGAANIRAVAYPDRNAEYIWYADGVEIGRGINFPSTYAINTPNTDVKIKLVVTSSLGCLPSETPEITYSTRDNVAATFQASAIGGCGPTTISFTNTSPLQAGATFEWIVDGAGVSTALNYQQTFNPDPSGIDKVYSVVLRTNSPCGPATSTPLTITIKSIPSVPALRPSTQLGCSKLFVRFDNISPGRASNRYIVNFGDGTETTYDYNQPISHEFENLTDDNVTFYVRITAVNDCASTPGQEIPIVVLPSQVKAALLLKNPLQTRVCVGAEVIFINNTTGATTYLYEFSNGAPAIPVNTPGIHELPYRFTTPGTVTITMTATSPCGGTQSASQTIIVDPIPEANFQSDIVSGCPGFVVQFKNTSTGAFSYVWDFGDGSLPSRDFEPTHPYTQSGRYTVKLTAFNAQGCPDIEEKVAFVTVTPLPGAEIQVLPGNVIGIPNYTFNFSDLNPADPAKSYEWDFGDGGTSTRRDPAYTYTDTGTYWVRLKVKNQFDCESISLPVRVQITGVPGYLFLPNSFMPGGTSLPLQKFTAIGSGIKSWRMQVFNKWGQVIWETTQLDDGKPIEGWDGTYKGVPQPQGIYFWKVDVQLINGSEWKGMSYDKKAPKRTGEIYLIR